MIKWFKIFGLKRKLKELCPDEDFFALHSRATEEEKDDIWVQFCNFLANLKKFKPLRLDKRFKIPFKLAKNTQLLTI